MEAWKKCGVCKKEIGFNKAYQKCSISSCKKHSFCSVDCWSVHDSVMGHKSAYAEEETSPSQAEASGDPKVPSRVPRRKIVSPGPSNSASSTSSSNLPIDTLVVVSKLKNYVKAKSDMNTSGDVADELSQYIRVLINIAVEEAQSQGRKTLMARDFKNIEIN